MEQFLQILTIAAVSVLGLWFGVLCILMPYFVLCMRRDLSAIRVLLQEQEVDRKRAMEPRGLSRDGRVLSCPQCQTIVTLEEPPRPGDKMECPSYSHVWRLPV